MSILFPAMRIFLLFCLCGSSIWPAVQAQNADSLVQSLLSMPDDTLKVNQLGMWGSRYRKRDVAVSVRLLDSAYALASRLQSPKYIGLSLNELGMSWMERGDWKMAEECLQRGLATFQAAGLESYEAKCLNNLGSLSHSRGEPEKALSYFLQSLAIKEKRGDQLSLGIPLGNIGNTFMALEQYDKALEYLKRAEVIHEKNADSAQLIILYHNLGQLMLQTGDPSRAIGYFMKEIQISRLQKNLYGLMIAYRNIAEAYTRREEFVKAVDYLNKAYDLAIQLGNVQEQINIVNARAVAQMQLADPSPATLRELEANERSASVMGHKSGQLACWQAMATAHRKMGNKAEAKQCELRAQAIETELSGSGQAVRARELEKAHTNGRGE